MCAVECLCFRRDSFGFVSFNIHAALCFSNKCSLYSERKVVRFVMILSFWKSSFHSFGPAPKKDLSPAQMSLTLSIESSIVPEEQRYKLVGK